MLSESFKLVVDRIGFVTSAVLSLLMTIVNSDSRDPCLCRGMISMLYGQSIARIHGKKIDHLFESCSLTGQFFSCRGEFLGGF